MNVLGAVVGTVGLVSGMAQKVAKSQTNNVTNLQLQDGLPLNSATNTKGMTVDAMLYCKTNIAGYFFDGFMKVEYTHSLEVTNNPVETGASVTDHAYVKPSKIQMVIRMSDVHQSLVPGQFSGGWSRSVKAWDVLKKIQQDRIPVMVGTQLGMYYNMLIESLKVEEDESTYRGLYVTADLVELPIARVKTVKISKASQTTIETQMAQIQAVNTTSLEDQSILYSMGIGAGANTSSSSDFDLSAPLGSNGRKIKLTCYCYNCNDDGAGGWGTVATASGNPATVGVTCAMHKSTMRKYGLKLGDYLSIQGIGKRRLDDIAGREDILDIYVKPTGTVRHCKCELNPYSGKRVTFVKL